MIEMVENRIVTLWLPSTLLLHPSLSLSLLTSGSAPSWRARRGIWQWRQRWTRRWRDEGIRRGRDRSQWRVRTENLIQLYDYNYLENLWGFWSLMKKMDTFYQLFHLESRKIVCLLATTVQIIFTLCDTDMTSSWIFMVSFSSHRSKDISTYYLVTKRNSNLA